MGLNLLPTGVKPRETRRKVLLSARMRLDAGWQDARIHNISSRGLLVAATRPAAAGTYVDIRMGCHTVIGRAVWSRDGFFGVRSQHRLDVDALVEGVRSPMVRRDSDSSSLVERRARDRLVAESEAAHKAARSQFLASVFQYGLIALGGLSISSLAAAEVYELLSGPAAAIEAAFSPSDG